MRAGQENLWKTSNYGVLRNYGKCNVTGFCEAGCRTKWHALPDLKETRVRLLINRAAGEKTG